MSGTGPKALVFDWDNTLVDTWPTIHDALNATFAAMGTPLWTLEETKERVRHSLRDSFPKLFGARWEDARTLYLRYFEAMHLERLAPLPGALALIEALHARGCYLAIVSNKTGRLLRREVEALGWQGWFGRVIGAGDAEFDKPHRAPVDLALRDSGRTAGPEVWFVGDTDIDLACALNAGCTGVFIGPETAEAQGATLRFENCSAMSTAILPLQF
jgi:phosphoglycolate phosphatase